MWNNEKELKINLWDSVVYLSYHSWNIAVSNIYIYIYISWVD